ncbi:MAG: oligosaccharide repeat unit polymerase [Flavobacteriaceae bacterium]|nr:oligosaccharide repeat unit polymerase [Flavobacteriaceae bacterium]
MNRKIRNILLAILIYSPTLVNAPLTIIYLIISFIGFLYLLNDFQRKNIYNTDYFLMLFLVTSLIIYIFGYGFRIDFEGKSFNEYVPYTLFIVTTIYFSRHLNRIIIEYILWFILTEVVIGIILYILGIQYIFKPTSIGETEFGSSELYYYNKVYGLSAVSSVYAQKIFSGFLLLYFLKVKKFKFLILGILFMGLLITFNRTAIVSTIIFFIFLGIKELKNINIIRAILLFGFLITITIISYQYFEEIVFQFFRGSDVVDYSGRDTVFTAYISFIENNFIFGNFVNKVWMELEIGRIYHAHNSYLETLASLGALLSLMLFIYLWKVIKKEHLKYIVPILVYSLFQYGILWGVSYLDIIFFYFIFSLNKAEDQKININYSSDLERIANK